jgi:dTDP-glucose 4,6-dehydratase
VRILLAGGAGFIGTHLASRLLAAGHHVVAVDSFVTGSRTNIDRLLVGPAVGRLELIEGDICQIHLPQGPFDAVLHLASPASPRDYLRLPIETMEAGSIGTRRLLEIARRDGARFLLASTSEVYGDPQIHPQPEDYWGHVNPVGPRAVYDEAKRYAEAMATAFARRHGVPVRIARIFNTYGPGMRLDDGRVIPTLITQALRGEPLTVQGDGSQTRSYCYVSDLVSGLELLLWSDVLGPVNLGNDDEHSVLETARLVLEITGKRSPIAFEPLPQDDPRVRRPVLRRAMELLGWCPRVKLRDGLARTAVDIARRLADAPSVMPRAEVPAANPLADRRASRLTRRVGRREAEALPRAPQEL